MYKKYQEDLRKVQLSIENVEARDKMFQSLLSSSSSQFGKEYIDYIDDEYDHGDGDSAREIVVGAATTATAAAAKVVVHPLPPRPMGQQPQRRMTTVSRPAPHVRGGLDQKKQHHPPHHHYSHPQHHPHTYHHPRYLSGKIQLSRKVKDFFPPFQLKSTTIDVYPTNIIRGKYIRHAVTGMYKKIQGDDVHHFFKVSMCMGEKSTEPIHLYYFDPEEHEYHFKCQVSSEIKCRWMKQTLDLTTKKLQKLTADADGGGGFIVDRDHPRQG